MCVHSVPDRPAQLPSFFGGPLAWAYACMRHPRGPTWYLDCRPTGLQGWLAHVNSSVQCLSVWQHSSLDGTTSGAVLLQADTYEVNMDVWAWLPPSLQPAMRSALWIPSTLRAGCLKYFSSWGNPVWFWLTWLLCPSCVVPSHVWPLSDGLPRWQQWCMYAHGEFPETWRLTPLLVPHQSMRQQYITAASFALYVSTASCMH